MASSNISELWSSEEDVEKQRDRRLAPATDATGNSSPLSEDEEEKKEPHTDPFEVGWEANETKNPKNWSKTYRWVLTALGALLTFNGTFASSAPTALLRQMEADLSMSAELGTLSMSLFIAGNCVGPLLWGPISEQSGRLPILLISFVCHVGASIGCALSPNPGALLVFRVLAGTSASAPLTLAPAVLGDIWDPVTRGSAMTVVSLAPFAGPILGPVVSGYMAVAGTSWRWLFWGLTISSGVLLVATAAILRETYTPVLLARKAKAKRRSTGDDRYYAPLEREETTFAARAEATLARPFKLVFTEIMLFAITIYMSFAYGCLFLFFEAYPIVFNQGHHLNLGVTGLCFLPIFFGGCVAIVFHFLIFSPRYARRSREYAPKRPPPECHLEILCAGSFFFAGGFFWFGWTSYSQISFWAPMLAGSFLGAGNSTIFLSLYNYIVDAYLDVSASAFAANTVGRSIFGVVFPLFATQMFVKLGTPWASTVLGCIATLMISIPFLLMKFGARLRRKSRYAPGDQG